MQRLVRAMKTWNPGMWAGLSAMAAFLGAGANTLWITIPANMVLIFICTMSIAVTFQDRKHK